MKPDSKGYILFDFIYIAFWKRQNTRHKSQISGFQGLEARVEVDDKGEPGSILGDEAVLYRGCGGDYMIVGICQNSKNLKQ